MRNARRLRVFVVEDSEVVRTRLVAMLAELRGVVVAGEAGSVSYAYPQLRARGFAAGADWFLDKATEFPRIPAILGELQRASAEHPQ